ncbi:MAG: hypothetical protein QM753_20540 [Thermomicrobiales bacterium]
MSYILRKDSFSWNRLCSSLDVIEDTDEAVDAFLHLNPTSERRSEEIGLRYLALYGVLQVLYTQQDALSGLHRSLSIPFDLKAHQGIGDAREIRNACIGHPTEQTHRQRQASSNFVARITMDTPSDVLFMRALADGSTESERIDLSAVIAAHTADVNHILGNVLDDLQQRVNDHRERFKDDHMQDAIPDTLGYMLQKLSEAFYAPDRSIGGLASVEAVQNALDGVRSYLHRQDADVDAFDVLELIYDELSYPLVQLRAYFRDEPTTIADRKMGAIVAFYVTEKVGELRSFAADFDSSDDEPMDSETA